MDDHASKSLFAAASQYAASGVRPLENFVTEVFAWLLANDPGMASHVLRDLFPEEPPASFISPATGRQWKTQFSVSGNGSDADSILDLVLVGCHHVVLFEHKVGASLDKDQLEKYEKLSSTEWGKKERRYVFITADSQDAVEAKKRNLWKVRLWHEIAKSIGGYLTKCSSDLDNSCDPRAAFALSQFCAFLEEEGLGEPKMVDVERLASVSKRAASELHLPALMQRVTPDCLASELGNLGFSAEDLAFENRYGRVGWGIPRPADWTPGLFYGLIYDGKDHAVNDRAGVELFVIVDVNRNNPKFKDYWKRDSYGSLATEIGRRFPEENQTHFEDHANRTYPPPNCWHPLHLHEPLSKVIAHSKTPCEQQQAVRDWVKKVLAEVASLQQPPFRQRLSDVLQGRP